MSRLDVNSIRHTGGSADNITLDGSKNVTCENNLQVDGNLTVTGTVPASAFSSLTDTTVATSDPATNTNPSATGHIYVNKSTGEAWVCTNATTNANVWKNLGNGTGGCLL